MLQRVQTIALNTYRECVRARILIGLAVVAFVVAAFSLVIGTMALNDAPRVTSDLGTASISIFSILVAIIIAATSLHRELEQKTIFPVLARPMRRAEYIVGKYLGTVLTLVVFIAADGGFVLMLVARLAGRSTWIAFGPGLVVTALALAAGIKSQRLRTYALIPWAIAMFIAGVLVSQGLAPDERHLVLGSVLLTLLEILIVAGLATFFASFSSPFLSALYTFMFVLIGHSADSLAHLPVKLFGTFAPKIGVVLSKVLPNLQIYVPARTLLTGEAANADTLRYIGLAVGTSCAWTIGLLFVASLVFEKRDFL